MALQELLLVRHGESVGNVAATAAELAGAEAIALGIRDADVPLSDTGVEQAQAREAALVHDHGERCPVGRDLQPLHVGLGRVEGADRAVRLETRPSARGHAGRRARERGRWPQASPAGVRPPAAGAARR